MQDDAHGPHAPPTQPVPIPAPVITGDATHGIIPYKNPKALIAYYLAVASIVVPFAGVAAIILGILGLRAYRRTPVIRGTAHAIVGIVLGGVMSLLHLGCVGAMLAGLILGASNAGRPPGPAQGTPAPQPAEWATSPDEGEEHDPAEGEEHDPAESRGMRDE